MMGKTPEEVAEISNNQDSSFSKIKMLHLEAKNISKRDTRLLAQFWERPILFDDDLQPLFKNVMHTVDLPALLLMTKQK